MKNSSLILAWICIFIFLYGCNDQKKLNEFDLLCEYFEDLKNIENLNSISAEKRNNFIVERINANIPSHPAAQSWDAVSYAAPQDRYEIFKAGAESALGKEWSCAAMEELAPITGYNE